MPLTQPRRDNLLMSHYFNALGITGKELSRRAGVSHSQIYMARQRHVGARNAAKIARTMASLLDLSDEKELGLKAEIMGDPVNLLRAYLGNAQEIAETLHEKPQVGWDMIDGRPLSYKSGNRVLKKLQKMEAPETVLSQVRGGIKPPPSPPGKVTYTAGRRTTKEDERELLRQSKPQTAAAVETSGLSRREIYERAEVGRETLRRALYESCGSGTAAAISKVLAENAWLSTQNREAVRYELLCTPEEILENFSKKSAEAR